MKTLASLIALLGTSVWLQAGLVTFGNTSPTLISVHGVPMPPRSEQEFVFAVFLAPSTTVTAPGQSVSLIDPEFQLACGYTTNSAGVGRLVTRSGLDVGSIVGQYAGDTVDFVVRGWSSNLGYTWAEALANWNDGQPLISSGVIGASTVGNDLLLGGGYYPTSWLFGSAAYQVGGFNLIPEPSSVALTGLGMLALLSRRRCEAR